MEAQEQIQSMKDQMLQFMQNQQQLLLKDKPVSLQENVASNTEVRVKTEQPKATPKKPLDSRRKRDQRKPDSKAEMSRVNSEVSIAHSFVYTLSGEFKSEEQKAPQEPPKQESKAKPPRDTSSIQRHKVSSELPARFWPTSDPRRKG
mmetsp:Transcript_21214/g.32870  ORF Transcript_21214/g.32870 Transcript_21214/m.32870 type:complete len:147 (-) Transcript_21214:1479-1919(-)